MARLAWLVLTLGLGIGVAHADTLQQVRHEGALTCGVRAGLPGLSVSNGAGEWSGLFPDFCRAIAAAIFADPSKVTFVRLAEDEAFKALRAGQIDVLAQPTAWTFSRDTGHGVRYVGALYHRGYGLMAPRRLGVATALELSGADICVARDSHAAIHIEDFFHRKNMPFALETFDNTTDALQAYDAGRCDVYAHDLAKLEAQRDRLTRPDDHVVLSDVVGVEPIGPAVRRGDPKWGDIVRWTLFALIGAEELQLASDNVDDAVASGSPLVARFAGVDASSGKQLGLDGAWAYNIIAMVGNYGELFARHLGQDSALGHDRRLNALWRDGGLLIAPPIR